MKFCTIREAARRPDCPLPEHRLRALVRGGKLPYFRSGNRFLINPERAFELINLKAEGTVSSDD